jgi:hypothetical protein
MGRFDHLRETPRQRELREFTVDPSREEGESRSSFPEGTAQFVEPKPFQEEEYCPPPPRPAQEWPEGFEWALGYDEVVSRRYWEEHLKKYGETLRLSRGLTPDEVDIARKDGMVVIRG